MQTQKSPVRLVMPTASGALPPLVAALADDFRTALLGVYAAVPGAPSDIYVQRLCDNLKREVGDHRRSTLPEQLARLLCGAQADGASAADLTKLARRMLAQFGMRTTPTPARLRAVSLDEQRAQQPLDLMQCDLGADIPVSQLIAIEDACEAQLAATRELRDCARAARLERLAHRQVA